MAINEKLIKQASKHLGKRGNFVWSYFGLPRGTAWCAAFVYYCVIKAGLKDKYLQSGNRFWVPTVQEWLHKNATHVKMADAKPGDIVIFTWSGQGYNSEKGGSRNHIGFIRAKGTSQNAYTLEGNTSGGIVAKRTRNVRYIYGIYRLHDNSSQKAIDKRKKAKTESKVKVYLSPSNHGTGANKCLKTDCYEDKHTRPIAEACEKYLKASGVEVIVANKSKGVLNNERCNEADSWGADLYVPIHTNASSSKNTKYLMFMALKTTGKYKTMLDVISKPIKAIYDGKCVYDARPELREVAKPKAPTFYCELGFHTNPDDVREFIHKPDMLGKALAKGICDYLGVTFCPNAGKYKVKCKSLCVRKGAGKKYKVVKMLKNGDVIKIVEVNDTKTWGKLSTGGWVNIRYIQKV